MRSFCCDPFMCACRDDTDLITSLPPPPPHLKTPKRFLVTFWTLGFEAWRASSPRAGFSQGCQHPVFSAPSPSSPCTLPSPCSSCLIPLPVTPTPDVVRVLFYVPAAPRPSARPTRSVFSHGLQVAKPEPDPPASEASRSARCPQGPWTSALSLCGW